MRLFLSILISIVICSCNQDERVIPDISSYDTVTLDTVQAKLSKQIAETSGLVKIDGSFWTHNDSGGKPVLYEFDPATGDIVREVYFKGAKNVDWEDVTADSSFVYVGNFGNNRGNRKDLAIYKAKISDLLSNDEIECELITFRYPDQEKYYSGYNHNHDCESMIAYGDKLYLFSKNWQNMRTKLYSLPNVAGDYVATMIDTFDVRGTLTGASFSDDYDQLFLLGYNPGNGFDPFVWSITEWTDDNFLSGDMSRTNISNRRQTEGIVMANDSTLYISAEYERGGHPILMEMAL